MKKRKNKSRKMRKEGKGQTLELSVVRSFQERSRFSKVVAELKTDWKAPRPDRSHHKSGYSSGLSAVFV